jgi:hypothetical protein
MPIAAEKVRLTLHKPGWFACAFAWVEFEKGIKTSRNICPTESGFSGDDFGTDDFQTVAHRIVQDALDGFGEPERIRKLIVGHVYNGDSIKDTWAHQMAQVAIETEIEKYKWL